MIILLGIVLLSCKKKEHKTIITSKFSEKSNLLIKKDTTEKKIKIKTLKSKNDFKKLLASINKIKYTGEKHSDELTNSSSNFINEIFGLDEFDLYVKTTSYEYKKECVVYLHNIKCVNDSISIKPFLEKAQGKFTEGYLSNRVFILAMKDDMTANYIDIPEKMNPYKLRLELIDTLYKEIKSDVIICDRWNKCVYKDFRKKK